MTPRELLLDTFNGKRTERVPVAPFIYNNLVNEYNGGASADPIGTALRSTSALVSISSCAVIS